MAVNCLLCALIEPSTSYSPTLTTLDIVGMKRYRGKLSYLPVSAESRALLAEADAADDGVGPVRTPLLVPLDQPVPDHWVTVEEEFVLVGAVYQSHLAKDNLMAPHATLDDGVIHLIWTKSSLATRIGNSFAF